MAKKAIILLGLFNFAVFAKNFFIDPRDSETYKIVEVEGQTWMAENLNYNAPGSLCYGNKLENCAKYGRLYDWATAKEACPHGWHLPSDADWQKLVDFAGGEGNAGDRLKAKIGWNDHKEQSGNGADNYGFSVLPGGNSNRDTFRYAGNSGHWWSATEYNAYRAYRRYMYYNKTEVDHYHSDKMLLFSVRCVQN
ncbi:MAG: fibrobacter succinogenes major paralogous domain-containing protein [Candidatus Fibromonas sp.]|jgi:uncharacterized protein (TIGR02145 family)|nr:fibrobacter succinogenes major paralogous domain-containing protein [Candidatus Fibromonas sp.]